MCQVTADKAVNFTCGEVDEVVWTLEKTDPYMFSVEYDEDIQGR